MMDGRDFYITLPSDSSLSIYPDNNPCSFKTKLCTPLHLKGQWEVALSEISYTHSFYNIWDENNMVFIRDGTSRVISQFRIPEGYYKNTLQLTNAIKNGIRSTNQSILEHIDLREDNLSRKCIVRIDNNCELVLHRHVAKLLGFQNYQTLAKDQTSQLPIDLNRDMHVFYLYTDLIQPTVVGHDVVPLLHTVDVSHNKIGDVITKSYSTPHYIAVRSNDIDEVEININTSSGKPVHFIGGIAIVKLHFRRRSPLLN